MARLRFLDADDVDDQYRPLLSRPINLFRVLINTPEGFAKFHAMAEWIRWECELDPRVRELLILQVGYLTRDRYEWSHHVQLSAQFGVTDNDIRELVAYSEGQPTGLGEAERLVLDFGTQLTQDRAVDDATWSRLESLFPPARLADLVLVGSFYSMVVRVLGSLQIEVEDEFSEFLDRHPLPTGRDSGRDSGSKGRP